LTTKNCQNGQNGGQIDLKIAQLEQTKKNVIAEKIAEF